MRQWVCLDDGGTITNEDEYCFHAAVYPKHRIVVDEDASARHRSPRFEVRIDIE